MRIARAPWLICITGEGADILGPGAIRTPQPILRRSRDRNSALPRDVLPSARRGSVMGRITARSIIRDKRPSRALRYHAAMNNPFGRPIRPTGSPTPWPEDTERIGNVTRFPLPVRRRNQHWRVGPADRLLDLGDQDVAYDDVRHPSCELQNVVPHPICRLFI